MVTMSHDLTLMVMEALQNDPRTKDEVIDVVNERGIVTLTGTVDSAETRREAEEITRQQPGVISVINELKTNQTAS